MQILILSKVCKEMNDKMSRREYFKEENRIKKTATIFSIVLAITIVAFGFMFNVYNKKLRESARQSLLELGSINAVVPNQISTENLTLEPASATQDKGINQVANEVVAEAEKKSVQKRREHYRVEQWVGFPYLPSCQNNEGNHS